MPVSAQVLFFSRTWNSNLESVEKLCVFLIEFLLFHSSENTRKVTSIQYLTLSPGRVGNSAVLYFGTRMMPRCAKQTLKGHFFVADMELLFNAARADEISPSLKNNRAFPLREPLMVGREEGIQVQS